MSSVIPGFALPSSSARLVKLSDRLRLNERFGACASRDFRLIFFGQAVSAIGSWMQMVVQGWLVYSLTGSSFCLGLVALGRAVPVVIFSLIGGAIADRADRRFVIGVANTVAGILAAVLGLLTLT